WRPQRSTVVPYTTLFRSCCQQEKLCYQQCSACKAVQPVPRMYCSHCHGQQLNWHESAGWGSVLRHSTVHRASSPAFRDDAPYIRSEEHTSELQSRFDLVC